MPINNIESSRFGGSFKSKLTSFRRPNESEISTNKTGLEPGSNRDIPAAHRIHTAVLQSMDKLVGEKGIRRFPGGHVVITDNSIAEEILSNDLTHLRQDTGIYEAIGDVCGSDALLAPESIERPDIAQRERDVLYKFLHEHRGDYVKGVEDATAKLVRKIKSSGGIDDLYEGVHGVFISGFLNTLGQEDIMDNPRFQEEIVTLSSDLGIKTIFGTTVGERVSARKFGNRKTRYSEITNSVSSIVENNTGFWSTEDDQLTTEALRANIIMLFGAATTSPAGAVAWSIYDSSYDQSEMQAIRSGNRSELTALMARTLSRHPFGFVLSRSVSESFEAHDVPLNKGDHLWLITVPGKTLNEETTRDIFGMSFSSGPKDCMGKHLAINSYIKFMEIWGQEFSDWEITESPKTSLYVPTLKPKKMSLRTYT